MNELQILAPQVTDGWEVSESGINLDGKVACSYPIGIKKRYINLDTGVEKVELTWKKQGVWKSVIIPASQYGQPRELQKLSDLGLNLTIDMAKLLSDYLATLYDLNIADIPVCNSVGRLGWIADGVFSPYVDSVSFDGGAEYEPIYNALKPKGTLEGWIEAAKQFRQQSMAARIVLAASFASVLVKPLGALPFFVHLWSTTSGTGKTVALTAAASVWANPEMGLYLKTFDGTDVGFERMAAFLNSMPLCIDELQLAKGRTGQVKFNPYKLAQGAGRVRGTKTGGMDVTPTWANAILTTGETPLTSLSSGAGAINRVIEIEIPDGEQVCSNGHDVAQAFKSDYGHAGRAFVEALSKDGEFDRVKQVYNIAFEILNAGTTTDKQAASAALLVAADDLATRLFFNDDLDLQPNDIAKYLADKESVSTGARAYSFICDWIVQNSNRLNPMEGTGDIYGDYQHGDEYAYIIATVFDNALDNAGFNPKAVRSYLKSKELGKVITHRCNGAPTRCIAVKPLQCVTESVT